LSEAKLTFLGTGTSYGVPMIGCRCDVCVSTDPRNVRSRCSSLLEIGDLRILLDVTPDFRSQALAVGLDRVDAVVITHVHADHVFGLDDLRPLSLGRDEPLPVFADKASCAELRQVFGYVFRDEKKRMGIPYLSLQEITPGDVFGPAGVDLLGFHAHHGRGHSLGIRWGDFAYLTDAKEIPRESMENLDGVQVLALDMLREEPHATHMCLQESLEVVRRLGDPPTWFIHMGHEVDHVSLGTKLPEGVQLAHDGLIIDL